MCSSDLHSTAMSNVLDLGSGVKLTFTSWAPDRDLNPQYAGIPDVERYGAILEHPLAPGVTGPGPCVGGLTFENEVSRKLQPAHPRWTVQSWDPLTITPSVLCACGFHGFITAGKWVPA